MKVHYLQHVPHEGLGSIDGWFRDRGARLSATRFFEDASLPDARDVDFVVAMGGPMSVNDEAGFPWLAAEKQFLRDAIEAGTPVLGICLGAQLIAGALGARVYPNPEKEIGWFPVTATASAEGSAFSFPESIEVFHWHGETFDLPDGAVHLARSEACEKQAFQIGGSVVGLQFHLEATPDLVRGMVEHARNDLKPSRFVQSESEILAPRGTTYRRLHRIMPELLGSLCEEKR